MREELTLAEFFHRVRKGHGTKKLSWRDDQQRFRDYLLPALGKRKLSAIDRAMVARMLSDADKAGKSAGLSVRFGRWYRTCSPKPWSGVIWMRTRRNP